MSSYGLENVPTWALLEELSERDGVERTDVDPYDDSNIEVNGPAVVLVVID